MDRVSFQIVSPLDLAEPAFKVRPWDDPDLRAAQRERLLAEVSEWKAVHGELPGELVQCVAAKADSWPE